MQNNNYDKKEYNYSKEFNENDFDDSNLIGLDDKVINKCYKISRIILTIITFLITIILGINKLDNVIVVSIIIALFTYSVSYSSTMISKKLVGIGDKLDNNLKRVIYYFVILPIVIAVVYSIIYVINKVFPISNQFETSIAQTILFFISIELLLICIIVPYIQTLIVLVIRNFIKK